MLSWSVQGGRGTASGRSSRNTREEFRCDGAVIQDCLASGEKPKGGGKCRAMAKKLCTRWKLLFSGHVPLRFEIRRAFPYGAKVG